MRMSPSPCSSSGGSIRFFLVAGNAEAGVEDDTPPESLESVSLLSKNSVGRGHGKLTSHNLIRSARSVKDGRKVN